MCVILFHVLGLPATEIMDSLKKKNNNLSLRMVAVAFVLVS
jgi:hypothetical protein